MKRGLAHRAKLDRTQAKVALVAATVSDLRSLLIEDKLIITKYLLDILQEEVDRVLAQYEKEK